MRTTLSIEKRLELTSQAQRLFGKFIGGAAYAGRCAEIN